MCEQTPAVVTVTLSFIIQNVNDTAWTKQQQNTEIGIGVFFVV